MAKAVFDTKDGRTFEFQVQTDFLGAQIEYCISEVVRPKWKIFRTRFCRSGRFWIEDFPTVREGLKYSLALFLAGEQAEIENRKKYQDFINGG